MVERTKNEGFEEFKGTVVGVTKESGKVFEDSKEAQDQYHIEIEPLNVKIEGETGKIHEWLRVSAKATDNSVPEDSVMDRFLQELEVLDKEVKDISTVEKALESMNGKSYFFKRIVLGKSFGKHDAKLYWTPKQVLTTEQIEEAKKELE